MKERRKIYDIAKAAAYFVLHIPVTIILASLYLKYSFFALDVGDDFLESRRISEIILVLSFPFARKI